MDGIGLGEYRKAVVSSPIQISPADDPRPVDGFMLQPKLKAEGETITATAAVAGGDWQEGSFELSGGCAPRHKEGSRKELATFGGTVEEEVRGHREQSPKTSSRNNGWATPTQLLEKLNEQGFRCAITGRELTPPTCEPDHIISRANGGSDTIDNLQWIHVSVNRAKGSAELSEFVAMCCDVADWTRRKD